MISIKEPTAPQKSIDTFVSIHTRLRYFSFDPNHKCSTDTFYSIPSPYWHQVRCYSKIQYPTFYSMLFPHWHHIRVLYSLLDRERKNLRLISFETRFSRSIQTRGSPRSSYSRPKQSFSTRLRLSHTLASSSWPRIFLCNHHIYHKYYTTTTWPF